MDVPAVIKELLFSHDCVILPGFGGFIGNYSPARIDKSNNTLHPPVKLISFNRNLNHNDGLLIDRISALEGTDYNHARYIVEDFVAGIKKQLSRGEKVLFDGIGTFVNNSEGNMQFEPYKDVNFDLNSYGLTSFQFPLLEDFDVRRRVFKELHKETSGNSNFQKYLWRAAIIIPLAGTLVALPLFTDIFKTSVQITSLNPLVKPVTDSSGGNILSEKSNTPASVVTAKENPSDTISLQPAREPVTTSQSVQATVPEEYGIIAGSFKSESNALMLIRKLSAEGYIPEMIKAPNGFFRVSAVKYSTLSEALSKKDDLSVEYPGAWVYKIK
ncbi:MAG: SPOR domain-containing protein [Bacteroidales bacterium]|nr:SPOR domain-containing protein [Bacteroidales bacterium]